MMMMIDVNSYPGHSCGVYTVQYSGQPLDYISNLILKVVVREGGRGGGVRGVILPLLPSL